MQENLSTVEPVAERQQNMGPLLPQDTVQEMRNRWNQIQTGFVDEPRTAVKQADELVEQAIQRLSDDFASTRARLEGQWDKGEDTSTEDLRVALQRYRTFFHRLLTV